MPTDPIKNVKRQILKALLSGSQAERDGKLTRIKKKHGPNFPKYYAPVFYNWRINQLQQKIDQLEYDFNFAKFRNDGHKGSVLVPDDPGQLNLFNLLPDPIDKEITRENKLDWEIMRLKREQDEFRKLLQNLKPVEPSTKKLRSKRTKIK